MDELRIKEAFAKVKEDISEIKEQLALFSQEVVELKTSLLSIYPADTQTHSHTLQHIPAEIPAHPSRNSSAPAHNLPLYALKSPNLSISTGNEGVPADRQTDRQTDQHTGNEGVTALKSLPEVLETLNSIKEEVRIKFKHLTKQEIIVFSTIYSLEEQSFPVDYSLLATKLSLTESSIRDYIQRLIKKGLPLIKIKENNKKIFISISPEFKKLVSLSTLNALSTQKEN